jgi:hypothetical protein
MMRCDGLSPIVDDIPHAVNTNFRLPFPWTGPGLTRCQGLERGFVMYDIRQLSEAIAVNTVTVVILVVGGEGIRWTGETDRAHARTHSEER